MKPTIIELHKDTLSIMVEAEAILCQHHTDKSDLKKIFSQFNGETTYIHSIHLSSFTANRFSCIFCKTSRNKKNQSHLSIKNLQL